MAKRMQANVEIINQTRACAIKDRRLSNISKLLLHKMGMQAAQLNVYLVGAAKIKSLKKQFFNIDAVTDVLSFPYMKKAEKNLPWILGEIVICVPVAAKQAKTLAITLEQQLIRLLAHGLVHLSGLDHEKNSREYKKFHNQEIKLLKGVLKNIMPLTL